MPMTSIGDRAFSFQSIRQTTQLKTQLQQRGLELSSGERADLAKAVGPDQRFLARLDQDLTRLDAFDRTTAFVGQRLTTLQSALGNIDTLRETLIDRTLIPSSNPSAADIAVSSEEAETVFTALVTTLNTRAAGRSLFAGQSTDTPALLDADLMMTALRTEVLGAGTQAELTTRITAWFDDPAGGFATTAYLGDGGAAIDVSLSETRAAEVAVNATDPALRDMLKFSAIAALAADAGAALGLTEQRNTLAATGISALGAAENLASLRGQVGAAEARVAEARAENGAARTMFGLARNELTAADLYETASRLQQLQQSLELHFAATARLSRLSLANYL